MRVWVHLSLLVVLQARQQDLVIAHAIQSSVGVALLLLATLIYYLSSRPQKQLVTFESYELTHPPTPIPVLKPGKDDTSTSLPSTNLKELSFESD